MNRHAPNQTEFLDFYLPFNGRLDASNRWAKLAEMVPWDVIESCYAESLAGTGQGAPAKSGRIAYGALLIKERLGNSSHVIFFSSVAASFGLRVFSHIALPKF